MILGIIMLTVPGKATMLTVNPFPGSFPEINNDIGRIIGDMASAQCGGWDWETPAGPFIAVAWGVPGHNASDPLGNYMAGMALREETGGGTDGPIANTGFEFAPTQGITSACRPGFPGFYEQHPCQRPPGIGPQIFKPPSLGGNTVDPFDGVQWTCDALCDDLNRRWIYDQYEEFSHFFDGFVWIPIPIGPRDTVCYDTDTQAPPPPPTPGPPPPMPFQLPPPAPLIPPPPNNFVVFSQHMWCCTKSPVGGAFPNCIPCTDDECRQELPSPGDTYKSYFRSFQGSCSRDKLSRSVPDDDNVRIGVPVACYGLYEEFDPKFVRTTTWDRHCTIANTYDERDHDFIDMPQTQVSDFSEVEYGQTLAGTAWPDPPSGDYNILREPGFDTQIDLWYPNISGGFSLINGEVFERDYDDDFTFALMAPDITEFKAYPQLTDDQLYSSGAYLRGFDDTASNDRLGRRTITEWWQEIETESHKAFSPPHVRLLLPPTWSIGLDPLDPFFSPNLPDPLIPPPSRDPRLEPIEVQLNVEEDLMGEVAAYFERSLILRLQEEAIPVVVPFGSPTEYRAKAHAWCIWHMRRNSVDNCDNVGGPVGDLIFRLEGYAAQLDKFRALRAELAHYEAALLEDQQVIIQTIGNWLQTNVNQYEAYRNSVLALEPIKDLWENAQALYRTFHDKTNQPWCMNQRFTTSIYSMLDDTNNWFPGRPNLDGCIDGGFGINDPNCLPRFQTTMIPDAVIDFSLVRAATGALRLPVLKPIQVSLARFELDPPDPLHPSPHIPVIPDLPVIPVPTIYADVIARLPDVLIEQNPPTINSFIPSSVPTADPGVYQRIYTMIQDMNAGYSKYWESLTLDPAAVVDGTEEDCLFPDIIPCVHVEMDLIERFVRMCSRPAVLLDDDPRAVDGDFDSIGKPMDQFIIDFDECPREDWACQQLNQEKYHTQRGWGWRAPDEKWQEDGFIAPYRGNMFRQTLLRQGVPADQKLKFFVDPDDITPSFETQGVTNLIPVPGQSSSSAGP